MLQYLSEVCRPFLACLPRHLVCGMASENMSNKPNLDSPATDSKQDTKDENVIAYYFPKSICSQKVLLALAEKNIPFSRREISLVKLEQFEPWYVKKNPNMVVPTLEHNGKVVCDSAEIVLYLDHTFSGPDHPSLACPKEVQATHDVLYNLMADFPTFWLSFGILLFPELMFEHMTEEEQKTAMESEDYQHKAAAVPHHQTYLENKIPFLKKMADENPDLKDAYTKKQEDMLVRYHPTKEQVQQTLLDVDKSMDTLEAQLIESKKQDLEFLVSKTFSTADLVWIICLHRCVTLGLEDRFFSKRPHLQAYIERLSARPGCRAVLQDLNF